MDDGASDALGDLRAVGERLVTENAALAEWTARSAHDSPALVERLEWMGYEVRGKSHDAVVEVLRRAPTRAVGTT